jgi:excinuclease ABC subunit C
LIQRSFQIPSCKIDLSRYHPRACLQHYIHRCLGPCVEGLTTIESYKGAIRDAQLLLEGRHAELERTLTARMMEAAGSELYESAAKLRDQISVVHQLQEKQRAATAALSDDSDVFGYHYEDGSLAVNLFHVRSGKIVDRREFFWDELPEILASSDAIEMDGEQKNECSGAGAPGLVSEAGESTSSAVPFPAGMLFSALLKQIYIGQADLPRSILIPVDFSDRATLTALLSERAGRRIELAVPLRGEKRSLVDLAAQNAKQSYIQRFRVLIPSQKAIQEALADALLLPELPRCIECFDISHIQGAETVASLVVWEEGKMNKQAYRKFKVKTVEGVDDFASMFEVVQRRYRRLQDEGQPLPSLVLVDGGLGQLHAAADALESVGLPTQPLASIAKKEEIIYVYGSEDDPIVLDRRSPVLHLVQLIRDESHRFAVGYHRQRRAMRDRESELLTIPGVGAQTRKRLLTHFGSLREVQQATADSLAAVVPRPTAEAIWGHFHPIAPKND